VIPEALIYDGVDVCNATTIGSLFSGCGGLDMAVERLFGGPVLWQCENNPQAQLVLTQRWPGVPNLGDITTVDWSNVPVVDVLCAGFPCQDVSAAAYRRQGLRDGTRSGLWSVVVSAIDALNPSIVVLENVRGLLHAKAIRGSAMESSDPAVGDRADSAILRAAGAVLGDLATLGYDAQWAVVATSDVGAAHKRQRVFVVARPANPRLHVVPQYADPGWHRTVGMKLLPTPEAKNSHAGPDYARMSRPRSGGHDLVTAVLYHQLAQDRWGPYEAAVQRWERLTRPAPPPSEPNSKGNPRLHPPFSEWMMGWPAGWVTDVKGVDRRSQMGICGNGVVPQQAYAAFTCLTQVSEAA
jgi:DNA (cytosine-5)-methyltransferase 1